jgi:hypothetical protein
VHTLARNFVLLTALIALPAAASEPGCREAPVPASWLVGPIASSTPPKWKDFGFSLRHHGLSVLAFVQRYGRPNHYLACSEPGSSALVYNLASGESLRLFVAPPSVNFLAIEIQNEAGQHQELVK